MIRNSTAKAAATAVIAASVLIAGQASAHLKATGSNTSAQVYSDGLTHNIRINGASTVLPFHTSQKNKRIAVLFNAESSVKANDHSSWLDIDVYVDGVKITPSTGDNAFDTSNGNGLLQNWESHATNGYYVVPHKGNHTVTVKGRLVGYSAGEQWRIDDISVIVMR